MNMQQVSFSDFMKLDQATRELPQKVIDEALRIGANNQNSCLTICAYFKKDKPDNARFLAEHYGENGAGFYLDGCLYSIWYNAEGIRIAQGESAQGSGATLLSWQQAATRIRKLLDLGRYMPQSELDRVDGYEYRQRAAQLWYLRQDFAEGTADAGFLPTVNAIYNTHQGFPEESAAISDLLGHPEGLQNLRDELEQFVMAYGENQELLRFHFHCPQKLLEQLSDLQREPLPFTAKQGYDSQRQLFISHDEIDNLLRGGKNNTGYRQAVYSFFQSHTDRKEREDFLKNYHGDFSGHYSSNDNVAYEKGKGIYFSHGSITAPYAKVKLRWYVVEKRISDMIAQGRFFTKEDQAAMSFEKQAPPYEVVVYHHHENGFDAKLDYHTLTEAVQAAQKYVDGTMEDENGFVYDGAGVYDLQENRWLRVFGYFPDEKAMEQTAHAFTTEKPQQPEYRYTIYQLKSKYVHALSFLPYSELSTQERTALAERYQEVYAGVLSEDTSLDDLFYEFNVNRPVDFWGHDLRISDVIVLIKNGKKEAYYCDNMGWREIPEFLKKSVAKNNIFLKDSQIRLLQKLCADAISEMVWKKLVVLEEKIMSAAKIFSIILVIGLSVVIIGNFVSKTQEENANSDEVEDERKTFVSSFVVNGVDLGAGYFYTNGSFNGFEYHFFNESAEKSICYKVDSYTIDTDKQQVEDERYMQAVREQINAADDNSIWQGFCGLGIIFFGILLLLAIFFIVFRSASSGLDSGQ